MINNLRYSDDTVILAEKEHELQHLMDIWVQESEQKGLFLNTAKSHSMVFSKSSSIPTCQIKVHGKPLEKVNSFLFLGVCSPLTVDARKKSRDVLEFLRQRSQFMKKVLYGRNISMPVRLRVLKCYILSTLLYGCETWTLSKWMMKNLEAAEHWFLIRMLRIPRTDKVSTFEVFRRVGVGKGLVQDMIRRQMTLFGHVIRKH